MSTKTHPRCSATVYDGMWPRGCRGPVKARIGALHFCGIHNPSRVPTDKQVAVVAARKAEDEAEAARERLIAAAPDLLAALQAVEQAQRDGAYEKAFGAVRAAIAKATGSAA